MKNFENSAYVTELTLVEQLAIEGGTSDLPPRRHSFWNDLAYAAGAFIKSLL
jgi:hypothetical protein